MPRRPRGTLGRERSRVLRREILAFTEGESTEDGYLVHWRREFRDRVLVTVDTFHGGPLQLVERAIDSKRSEASEERRGRGRAHDEIWCVFDRDAHPNVPQAIEKAGAHGINIVISNPCIELWFMLHFEDQTGHLERGHAQRRSRDLLGCAKSLTPTALKELSGRYSDAKRRARLLDEKHLGDGSSQRSNPSSNMWQLVDRIRNGEEH